MEMFLDIRTLSFVMGVTIFALSLAMIHYAASRKIYPGFGLWTLGFVLVSMAFLLIGFQQRLPSFITVIISNAFIFTALAMFYLGFKSFARKRGNPYLHAAIVLLLSFGLFPYFTYFTPSVNFRIIIISFAAAFYFLSITLILVKEIDYELVKLNKLLTATLLSISTLLTFRGIFFLLPANTIDHFMAAGRFHGLALLAVMILCIFFVIGLMQLNSQILEKELDREQRQLKESEERYRHLVDQSLQGLIIAQDNPMRLSFISKPMETITGYANEELLHRGSRQLADLIHSDDREMLFRNFRARLSGKAVPSCYEFRILHKTRGIRWIEVYASLVEYKDAPAVHAVFLDITQRKKAEEAIVRANEEWERTFNAVPDLIAIIDENFQIVRANKAMAEKLGLGIEEIREKTCYECVHRTSEPPLDCPHKRLLADGREHVAEVAEDRLGGDFLVTVSPFFDSTGRLIGSVHVARDITAQKRIQKALKLTFRSLKKEVFHFQPRVVDVGSYPE